MSLNRWLVALLPLALFAAVVSLCSLLVVDSVDTDTQPVLLAALPKGAQLHLAHSRRVTLTEAHRDQ